MNLCTVVGLQGRGEEGGGGGGGGREGERRGEDGEKRGRGERGREACCNSHGCSSDKLLEIIVTVAASYSGLAMTCELENYIMPSTLVYMYMYVK